MKKLFTTILALLLAFGTFTLPSIETDLTLSDFTITASAEAYGDFKYSIIYDGTVEITDYTGSDSKLAIPGTIDGKKVTSFGEFAFSECPSLTSITIPNSVTSIGDGAFYNCTSLKSITIPNRVTSIGNYAFENCTSLTSVTIPNSVTSIGEDAFYKCTSLTSITIPNSVTSIGNDAFYKCTSLTSITIPNSVTSIGYRAFNNCTSLTSITIPNSVASIGDEAFSDCTSLTSITIPNSVTSIGKYAFYNCTSLTSITIPNSVASIGDEAFSNCTSLTSVTIPNSVTSIGVGAFEDCTSLTSITIPNSVTRIEDGAFSSCTSLTSITIPNSVTSIRRAAFNYCTSLTSITIPNSVTSIEKYAFYNCTSLTSITIPNSITSIGSSAFDYCTSLTDVYYTGSETEWNNIDIRDYNSCLTDATIHYNYVTVKTYRDFEYSILDDGTVKITDYTGSDSKLVIPGTIDGKKVTSIGGYAFEYCESLTSVTIPNSVTSIGGWAFKNCTSLIRITIPNGVTSIGSGAFINCANLKSITIPNSVTSIGYYAFSYCPSLTSITIPNNVTSIGDYAFEHCVRLTSITIPNSVTSIEYYAFYNCTSLTDVYYTGSETEWNNIDIRDYNSCLTNATIHYNYAPNHTHSYTSKITKQPTCTATGVRTFTCSCGDSYTETIPATGHKSSGWIVDKAASIGVKGSKHKECTVCKKVLETAEIPALSRISISKASVTLSTSTYAYDGKAKTPSVNVKVNGKTLKKDTDYTVSYSNNTKVGTAKVTITGKGNYTGSVSKTYSIKNNFKKATVSSISTKAFTGKNITQSITVKYNGKTLKNGTDYTVSYSSNKNIGTATVKITGKGSYTGTITKTFKINPAKQEIQKLTAKSKAFFVDWAQKGSATGYEIQYATNSKFTSAKKVTITNKKTDTKTVSKLSGKKKYYVRVRSYTTVKGTKYYGAWSASKSVTTKK